MILAALLIGVACPDFRGVYEWEPGRNMTLVVQQEDCTRATFTYKLKSGGYEYARFMKFDGISRVAFESDWERLEEAFLISDSEISKTAIYQNEDGNTLQQSGWIRKTAEGLEEFTRSTDGTEEETVRFISQRGL